MSTYPNIVILDAYAANPGDLSWNAIRLLGETQIYPRSSRAEAFERVQNADIILTNKHDIDTELLAHAPKLKLVCVTATGYNCVDLAATSAMGVSVCNVAGYSTNSVAQHVFAMMLALQNRIVDYAKTVNTGQWQESADFCYYLRTSTELSGKTMGIYGLGRIGNRVANIALAFGMNVLATHKHPVRDARDGIAFVKLEELFEKADYISLHAPLSDANFEIVNHRLLLRMKPSAFLINTGRGPLINEADLAKALENDVLAGAALDVLSTEPPKSGNVLINTKNCIITPHIAWASREARAQLIDWTANNISAFLLGKPQNIVS